MAQTQGTSTVDLALVGGVPIGPDGRDPSIALPRIQHFLVDEDSYRHPGWQHRLDAVKKYVDEAEKARLRGDLGYDDDHVKALLEDVRILVQVHLNFDKWKTAPSRWSSDIIPTPNISRRLPPLPDQPIPPPPNKKRTRRKWVDLDAGPQRRSAVFSKLASVKGPAEIDRYEVDEEQYFEAFRTKVGPKPDLSTNRFRLENDRFESCIEGGINTTRDTQPPQVGRAASDEEFYQARGWQRAAIQQCLNMFTNHENRVINTPWRRVVLPYKEPLPLPKEIVYHPRALAPDRVSEDLKEPFPWFYWYSQYSQLKETMAGWERQRYHLNNWKDFQRSALPTNYNGPYLYDGLSVYDDHWLKIGAYLRRLRDLMFDAVNKAPRSFMLAILRDIEAGSRWQPDGLPSIRDERSDIMRRGEIDEVAGPYSDAVLIDEADAAWLRFLCEPSRNREMCDPKTQADDNLTILFQTRLEDFFNNTAVSGVSKIPREEVFDVDVQLWSEDYFSVSSPIQDALAYINGGPGAGESHANETYQFTVKEAQEHIVRLAQLGRCLFEVGSNGMITNISRPPYSLHPEHRVRWRHENREAFLANQRSYREVMVGHLMDEHVILTKTKDSDEGEFSGILDHLHTSRLLGSRLMKAQAAVDPEKISEGLLRAQIQLERRWVAGSYADDSIEAQREAPSWSDLMDWHTVGRVAEPQLAKNEKFEVPERTVQFFRSLAYRMGRTLAHVRDIERRLQYSVSAPDASGALQPTGETRLWKSISQNTLLEGIRHWQNSITYGASKIELLPPTLQFVIDKADPHGTLERNLKEQGLDSPYLQVLRKEGVDIEKWRKPITRETIVREGIVQDCVLNRNTLYPGRLLDFEDSSGYYKDSKNWQRNKLFVGQTRPSLFKWATKGERRYQAPFTRGKFFSMQRWPLFHQRPERQEYIQWRVDEIRRVNPSLPGQEYGILTQRLVSRVWEGTKGTIPASGTKEAVQDTKAPSGTNGTRDSPSTKVSAAPGDGAVNQDSTPSSNTDASAMSTKVAPQQGGKGPGRRRTEAPPLTRRLIPITRPRERFIPGPAIFPMAETLLQQIALSQTLTQLIYPQPEKKWYEKIANLYKSVTTIPEPLIPLLPSTTSSEVPRSNPRKRKIPADFILDPELRPGKRVYAQPTTTRKTNTRRTTRQQQPAQQAEPDDQNTIDQRPWTGLAPPRPSLGAALTALAQSGAVQHRKVKFPNADQLIQSCNEDVDVTDADYRVTVQQANETLQDLTGPGKQFPARSYHLALIVVAENKEVSYELVNPNRNDVPMSDRYWIWIYVNRANNSFTGVSFAALPPSQPGPAVEAPKDK
ncbi:hypothetical protein Hte_009410 [Hypoxylon texense]